MSRLSRPPGISRRRSRAGILLRRLSCVLALGILATVGAPLGATTFTVNSTLDAVDAAPGDGTCETAPGSGVCTLRAAVQEVNARVAGAPHTIVVPAGTYLLTIPGQGENAAATGDLDLSRDGTTIIGAGAKDTIIDGNGLDRVFDSSCCSNIYTFSGLTIRNGNPGAANGGGVRNDASEMTFTNVAIENNTAFNGGGIDNPFAILTLNNVTVNGNSAVAEGGGIRIPPVLPQIALTNVTISNNSASTGGGIFQSGSLATTLMNVTLSGNTGGNIVRTGGSITLTNTILADAFPGANCSGTIGDGGNNLADDTSCGTIPATLTGLDLTLSDNGGQTQTHALEAGSSALDTGTNTGCPSTDQRGFIRPANAFCDIGAYEESKADIEIDGEFSDWDGSIGTEYCIDDQGGADDWGSPSELDITRFCISTDAEDDLFLLFGFDEVSLNGNSEATSCVLVDTPPNDGNADYFFCVTLEGNPTSVKEVGAYSCDNDAPYECNNPTPVPSFSANYGFSNSEPGPFDAADSLLELEVDWDDLGISAGDVVFTAMISYPGQSAMNGDLNSPKDSILGGIDTFGNPYQDYDSKIRYNLDTGDATLTPVTLSSFTSSGNGVFEWTTAHEASNVGFNLLALAGEKLEPLNSELIPSLDGDAVLPQHYRFEAAAGGATLFMLEDVDIRGQVRHHGPFELGRSYGSEEPARQAIDWQKIHANRGSTPNGGSIGQARAGSQSGERTARAAAASTGGLVHAPATQSSAWSASSVSWTEPTASQRRYRPSRAWRARPRAEILVDRTGIVRVTYDDLLAAGIDFGGAPFSRLALFEGGRQVPIRVQGQGVFGPGGYVEFVGRGLDTLYTRTNVYTLTVAGGGARRVIADRRVNRRRPRTTYLETRAIEHDRAYHFASPTGDPWYDQRLLAYRGPAEVEIPLELDGYLRGPVGLEIGLWGVTDFPSGPDHHLRVEVNGVELADSWFDGLAEHTEALEIPGHLLEPGGGNVLRLELPLDTGNPYDLVHFDHYRVTYPRRLVAEEGSLHFTASGHAFRVDGFARRDIVAYRLTGSGVTRFTQLEIRRGLEGYSVTFPGARAESEYFVADASGLIRPAIRPAGPRGTFTDRPAEYLVVAHPDFVDALRPLVRSRARQGLSTRVVEVDDIYRFYSHGVVDPEAIRAFIARAFAESDTRYVLLVGGDTYDYHDHLGLGSVSFVPSLYAATGDIVRFAPADPLFGDVDRDGVPDLPIGRLPVRTVEELEAVIGKILAYERGATPRRGLFAADRFDLSTGYSFRAKSRMLSSRLPAGWDKAEIYLDELDVDEARERLIAEINDGAALVSYFGHSGASVWGFDRLFTAADVERLDNSRRPSIVAQWGCWNTYYVAPGYDTLSHRLLLSPGGGAAAVVGATTLTEADSEYRLAERMLARFHDPRTTLGDALTEAKRDLARTHPESRDVILGFTLLGDPALAVEPAN